MTQTINEKTNKFFQDAFRDWSGEDVATIRAMPAHGSDRRYYRVFGETRTAIAAMNHDRQENEAFLSFSKHFRAEGMPVPEIYGEDLELGAYLEEDLGDDTLFSKLTELRKDDGFSEDVVELYEKTIDLLPRFQVVAGKGIDYSKCYPRSSFDRRSMLWDLNYFKYYFLKLSDVPFNEHDLEEDFHSFIEFLLETDTEHFLYRDFQSRNVMIRDGEPYFIDYQGGRKGALQYDVASLLYDAKANIPQEIRARLLERYLESLERIQPIDRRSFLDYYHGYVLIRIMQALGAYGYRGYYQRKDHFLASIPFAVKNLARLLENASLPVKIPALEGVWRKLVETHEKKTAEEKRRRLTVSIVSFSYRRGVPEDPGGNGGGFVFDCRAVRNPGRIEKFMDLAGVDQPVIEFLDDEEGARKFAEAAFALVDQSVENYVNRRFTNLMVCFGCTGGQHRSVYFAERLAARLRKNDDVRVELTHRERSRW
jgi:aminoglycoside/choline kinase family phosphotransferase